MTMESKPILFAHAPNGQQCGWLAQTYMVRIGKVWQKQYFAHDVTFEDVAWNDAVPPVSCPICGAMIHESDFIDADII